MSSQIPWSSDPERKDYPDGDEGVAVHPVEQDDAREIDFRFIDQGSIILVIPLEDAARLWLEEHTDGIWWCGGLAVEPRYLEALVDGMIEDGWRVTV